MPGHLCSLMRSLQLFLALRGITGQWQSLYTARIGTGGTIQAKDRELYVPQKQWALNNMTKEKRGGIKRKRKRKRNPFGIADVRLA